MDTKNMLMEARTAIGWPDRWSSYHMAVDADGRLCGCRKAVRLNCYGALMRALDLDGEPADWERPEIRAALWQLNHANKVLFACSNIGAVNTARGHKAVLKLFARAINTPA